MYVSNYTTKGSRRQVRESDGRFAVTTATSWLANDKRRQVAREAARENEANRAQMIAWGLNPDDADLLYA